MLCGRQRLERAKAVDEQPIPFTSKTKTTFVVGNAKTFRVRASGSPSPRITLVKGKLPAGLTKSGLPVGIAIDGPEHGDHQVLAIGLALETLLPRLPAPRLG